MDNSSEGKTMDTVLAASGGEAAKNLVTQIDYARAGIVTPQMQVVARKEGRTPENIRQGVASGVIAIPANIHHTSLDP